MEERIVFNKIFLADWKNYNKYFDDWLRFSYNEKGFYICVGYERGWLAKRHRELEIPIWFHKNVPEDKVIDFEEWKKKI